jgi:AP-1-like factor
LKEYRKRLSLNNTGLSHSPPQSATQSRSLYNNGNGNDFAFAFPKFGDLPGSFLNNGSIAKTTSPTSLNQRPASASSTNFPTAVRKSSSSSTISKSPTSTNGATPLFGNGGPYKAPANKFNSNDFSELNGLFSPSILQNASRSNSADYISYPRSTVPSANGAAKQGSINSTNGQAHMANGRQGSTISVNSPSSSMSHGALDSSCGTTPESSADSPDNRKSSETTLNTIKEETKRQNDIGGKEAFCNEWAKACDKTANPFPPISKESNNALAPSNFVHSPAADVNGFNWMAQQNDGQFDPVLFGDYRDPQDNVLSNNTFGDFFNDAFPLQDFGSPYNTGEFTSPQPKRDLMQEIEVVKNGGPEEVVPKEQNKKMIGCDKLWFVPSHF